jgi:hypothetical protein
MLGHTLAAESVLFNIHGVFLLGCVGRPELTKSGESATFFFCTGV